MATVIATHNEPSFEETQRIASSYERELTALGELKKSLLHLAFSG